MKTYKKLLLLAASALSITLSATASPTAERDTAAVVHLEYAQPKRAAADPRANCERTKFSTTIGGKEYPIYVTTKNRRAFCILISKKGIEYRKYLGEEMTQRVNASK